MGSGRGRLELCDLRMGRPVHALKGLAGGVREVYCHPQRPYAVSVSLDRFLLVHDIDAKKLVHKVRPDVCLAATVRGTVSLAVTMPQRLGPGNTMEVSDRYLPSWQRSNILYRLPFGNDIVGTIEILYRDV